MSLARESGWVAACAKRINELQRGKQLFPQIVGEAREQRDRQYDREINKWNRKLFWAKYGHIRAAFVGTALGWGVGFVLLPLLLNTF